MSRTAPNITVVSAIIERPDHEVLICTPAADSAVDRRWEFPTGVKDPGESHEQAMRRVCSGRVGLGIEIDVGQPPFEDNYQGSPATYRFFIAVIKTGDAEAIDYDEIRWIKRGQLLEYDFSEAVKPVVAWYLEG